MKTDISIVIPPHRIGLVGHRTMRSLFRSVSYAEKRGVNLQIVIVMDNADERTKSCFTAFHHENMVIEEVSFGDLGVTRNHGVRLTAGKYVSFLDDDDLYCENWIYAAFKYLENSCGNIVVHPEYHIAFEAEDGIWREVPSYDSEKFKVENLLEFNYWDSICATSKQILLDHPYQPTTQTQGFGYEDWHFNCETLAAGIEHHIVPETVHFKRKKKSGSLCADTTQENRVIRPTVLFDPSVFESLLAKRKIALSE